MSSQSVGLRTRMARAVLEEHAMPPVFIVLILLFIALAVYAACAGAKRRKELADWARTNGLSFNPANDRSMDERFPDFRCLRQGHSRYAYNVMTRRSDQLPVTAFDYHYATGSGKNRSDHHLSAVILQSPIPLKPLFIRREGFFDKVSEFFGFDDIDFESAEFSRHFHVSSPDKRWAYAVIHQRMMEYLLNVPEFSIEFATLHVVACRSSRFATADFAAAVRLVQGIFERLPDYLVTQQTEGR